MGHRVQGERVLDVPPDVVWSILTDLEAYPDWTEGIRSVAVLERDPDDYPVLARFALDTPLGEIAYTLRYRYDDDAMRWQLVEGRTVTQLDGAYVITASAAGGGSGTHVRYELEADVDLPLPKVLKQRAAGTILEQGLAGLARRVAELG